MLKKVFLGLACLIAVLAVVISLQPPSFRVERATTVAAPPAVAFEQVNDFRRWQGWSPWEKLDLSMKKEFSGPATGAGAGYYWSGNDQVGEGRMTITDSRAPEQVVIRLEFLKPFAATNSTTFTFAPDGAGTKVTWAMEGKNNFMSKAFSLFKNMDQMIGKDFENGLAALKDVAEAEGKRRAAAEAEARAAVQPAPAPAPAAPATP